jgi:hypothetical protein
MRALQRELKLILGEHAGTKARYRQGRRFARNALKIWPALWTSTASSASAASPSKASAASNGCSPPTPPAGCNAAACTPYLIDLLSAHARGNPAPLLT